MPRSRVLIVDDSVVIRHVLREQLGSAPDIEVVGVAANGRIALAKIEQLAPDVIILDVEMPELDGLATLRELRRRPVRPRVIMFSSHTTEQAQPTVEALALGAEDCVAKPSSLGSSDGAQAAAIQALLERIRMLTSSRPVPPGAGAGAAVRRVEAPALAPPTSGLRRRVGLVAIGASTGGPNALCRLFARLPAGLPVPIVIVQHMPAGFTRHFAERLTRESSIRVEEGTEGAALEPGRAWIAPGGRHMVVRRRAAALCLHLHDEPPVWSCRPAVDVLFESVAAAAAPGALGVVMTGMGEDGKRGAAALRQAGCSVIVQDEQSSVVWGMAGAVATAGLAEAMLPPDELGDEICRRTRRDLP
ncbi:MAG: chemotaxis response regulator protein-glutamate methylesterase [Polyangia bacterium]